jgi:hypothetical protein
LIFDAHESIKSRLAKVLDATWQCCQVYFMRQCACSCRRQAASSSQFLSAPPLSSTSLARQADCVHYPAMGVRTRTLDLKSGMRRQAAGRGAREEAVRVVERWNTDLIAGQTIWWSPTIRAAVIAGVPWADVHRPGCRTNRSIDLRTVDRHPLASVGSLVLGLRCGRCDGAAPMPKVTGLYAVPPAAAVDGKLSASGK